MIWNFTMKIISLILLLSSFSLGQVKIGVIDGGLSDFNNVPLCINVPSKDFTLHGFNDLPSQHGTNIVNVIINDLNVKQINRDKYCFVIAKTFKYDQGEVQTVGYIQALQYLLENKVDIVNLSIIGSEPMFAETNIIKKMLDNKITVVVASGNESKNLDEKCSSYPACIDDRLVVVGSIGKNNIKSKFSNFGNIIDYWEYGEKVTAGGVTLSGTSQATAKVTAKTVYNLLKIREHGK